MKITIDQDMPLLEALAQLSPDSSKTTLRSWLKTGRVLVDEHPQKLAGFLVHKGQEVSVGKKATKTEEGVAILYQDDHFIVVDKPVGLLSVSTNFEKGNTLHSILKKKFRPKPVFVVHRLDQDTSGVMLFALSEKALVKLKEIFEKHEIERSYAAIVEGVIASPSGKWESYLYEDPNYVVRETHDKEKGKVAITHYEVIDSSKNYTYLNLKLETGRKNQIRVHCQKAGHPVVGDKKYGSRKNPIKRLCLHAKLLAFEHPVTKKQMRFESPVPSLFFKLVGAHA